MLSIALIWAECMLMFAFSLVVAFRFAIINCRNDSVEAFEPRERKKGAQMCTSWRFFYFISNDARTKSRDAHRWTVYMANVLAHMKPVSYILRFVKVAHQFQCTTIDYFDSCLCNFYCWFRRRKKRRQQPGWFIAQSVLDYTHFTATSSFISHAHQ